MDGSKYVVEVLGNVNRPGKYHALVGEDLISVVRKRAKPKRYSDLKEIHGKVEKDLTIWVSKLDCICVNVIINGVKNRVRMSCGSRVSDLRKRYKNCKIEKKLKTSRRLLKNEETIVFICKH